MEPEQCEFLAENEWIMIKPNFNEDQLHLICGDVGPFEAGMPVCVPLWMAVTLRKRHRCEIIPPEWLTVDELKKIITAETESIGFSPLPRFFLEIAHIVIRNAKEDLVDADQLKTYVQDVWDKRVAKMHTSTLKFLSQYESCHARMDNITQMEVSYAKAPIVAATRKIEQLHGTLRKLVP
uniref:DNA replication complex GINS protein PSF2 n=1 Tax=Parascaris univalens TaxID=6257 RepID=A0A915ADN9_PARUN